MLNFYNRTWKRARDFLSTVFTRKSKYYYIELKISKTSMLLITISKWNLFEMYSKSYSQISWWQHAFYRVLIHKDHKKYLKFQWLFYLAFQERKKKNIINFLECQMDILRQCLFLQKLENPSFHFCKNKACCRLHLLMIHICKAQQKSSVINMLMQQ